jgi:hypothetical protein
MAPAHGVARAADGAGDAALGVDALARDGGQGGLTMELNLGCGNRHREAFVNVDKFPECRPDELVDLSNRCPGRGPTTAPRRCR